MSVFLFHALLRLLPRHRRDRYGDEMRDVHRALARDARARAGVPAVVVLFMKELRGLMRFSLRERFGRLLDWQPSGGDWHPMRELHWAWRGVRARGVRAVLIVALLGLALAGNVIVFAVADSLVFTPVAYRHAQEIVEIRSVRGAGRSPDSFLSAALLDEWRRQTDLFSSVQAYLTKSVFVVANGRSEIVPTADITPGLVELLGVTPRWGRSLTPDDAQQSAVLPSLVSATLARELFGSPQSAVGKTIQTTAYPLRVVGVMPDDFMFPAARYAIWRPLDPRGPLARGFAGVQSIARIARGVSMERLAAQMQQRSAAIAEAAGARAGYSAEPGSYSVASGGPARLRTMFLVLLGGALCLLLTACANVASLELASALRSAKTSALQIALGASRWSLARVALFEGAILIVAAVGIGALLAWLVTTGFDTLLPMRIASLTTNPIDLDLRALAFMGAIAAFGWILTSLPAVLFASRRTLLQLLKTEDRSASASRAGVLLRRALTTFEVAVALMLVIGAAMYTRSYVGLLAVDKGFDASNLVEIGFTIPVEYYAGPGETREFADTVLSRVRSVAGVVAAIDASAPPSTGNSPFGGIKVSVDGRPPGDETFSIGDSPVPSGYFSVVGLPLRSGRWFSASDPATSVIVTESFARRFWQDGEAVGRSFRRIVRGGSADPENTVIGVVGDFRSTRPDAAPSRNPVLHYYTRRQPPAPRPPAPTPTRTMSSGGSWRFLNITARLDSLDRADAVLAAARSIDPRLRVTLESVDDMYAAMFGDVLLATRVTNAFGALAFLVAIVGVYGVMAYLVAGRRREIGVRLALGADRRDIGRLVLASAVRLVAIGTVAGLAGALVASRWTASQFFGVSPVDPTTYGAAASAIFVTAIVATWQPARQAARIDPAITLRAE